MINLYLNAAFIKQFKDFWFQKDGRWILKESICIRKFGDTSVEFASTDGQKLLVIRRPLADKEEIDDKEYVVSVGNLPLKGKYLSYQLTVADNVAQFIDGINVYKFPLMEGNYSDYRKLIEDARNCEKAKEYTAFKWENLKALQNVLSTNIWDVPKKSGHAYLWSRENDLRNEATYVLICSHLLNN